MFRKIRQTILVFGDIGAVYLSLLITVFFGFWGSFKWQLFFEHLFPFSILYISWLIAFYIFDLYNLNISRNKFLFYPKFIQSIAVCGVLGIAFFYLWPAFDITPKTNLALNIIFFSAVILIWRSLFYHLFSKRLLTYVGIAGQNRETKEVIKEIEERPYLGYKVRGVYGLPQINQNFYGKIQKLKIDILILSDDIKTNPKAAAALYKCLESRISFLGTASAYEAICKKIPVSFISKGWFLDNLKEREKMFYDKIKRIFDVFFAILLLAATSPLWPIIALLIKIQDSGPVFYKQKRVGKDKKEFLLFKFRSMKQFAEKNGAQWAKKDDPRSTAVGKLLRRTHLDELPQMLNVIKGDVSLVGPRPERPKFVKELEQKIPHYHLRHLIKPGITGWDQIKFKYARTLLDSFEKFEYDLYYLKNRSLFLDFGILLKTFQSLFRKTD